MGQYYRPLIGEKAYDNYLRVGNEKKYMGSKLTEHSFIGNYYVDSAMKLIEGKPQKVYWVGDYANSVEGFEEIHKKVWDRKIEDAIPFVQNSDGTPYTADGKNAVNHTKKNFIDLGRYKKFAQDADGYTFNPVCILCAVGNGQGGGDYYGVNKEKAGEWAGDMISIEENAPASFEDVTERYRFVEE